MMQSTTHRRTLRAAMMGLALPLLLLLQGCGAFLRHAPTRTEFPASGLTLPSRQCAHHFLVEARINGRGPFVLMLDTGAAATVLSPAAADALSEFSHGTLFGVSGATGRVAMVRRSVRIETLEVGGLRLSGFDAPVLDMSGFDTALGGRLDGILGYPAFRECTLTLDYAASEVRLSREVLSRGPGTLRLLDRDAPRVQMTLQGRPLKPVLDSGSSGDIMLKRAGPGAAAWEYVAPPRPVGAVLAIGGHDLRRIGRLRGEGELAGATIVEPLAEESPGATLLGTQILKSFVVTIDQRGRLARLEPVGRKRLEFPSLFGVGAASVPRSGQYEIIEVFEGSPAARAGLMKGDVLARINGEAVSSLVCRKDRLFTEEGVALVSILRGGQALNVEVEVVRLVP
jgi:hypothetical protein